MSDAELRRAERAFRASPNDLAAFEALQSVRRRAGQSVLCMNCRERESITLMDPEALGPDVRWCQPCVEDALKHGHEHVGHDDASAEVASLCPLCRRESKRCPDCRWLLANCTCSRDWSAIP